MGTRRSDATSHATTAPVTRKASHVRIGVVLGEQGSRRTTLILSQAAVAERHSRRTSHEVKRGPSRCVAAGVQPGGSKLVRQESAPETMSGPSSSIHPLPPKRDGPVTACAMPFTEASARAAGRHRGRARFARHGCAHMAGIGRPGFRAPVRTPGSMGGFRIAGARPPGAAPGPNGIPGGTYSTGRGRGELWIHGRFAERSSARVGPSPPKPVSWLRSIPPNQGNAPAPL